MRGIALSGRPRPRVWALSGAAAIAFATTLLGVTATSAHADTMSMPGTMTTATQAESSFAVHVPIGVDVRAVNGVVTEPEVVEGGTVTFRVNGAVRKTVPSALYQKVRIPVEQADVIADGTIGLTMSTEGPATPGATCVPAGGVASMRKIELDYRGTESAPTTVADFFPPTAAGVTVVIPEDADPSMITAGLTAVAALAYRYDDDTPVNLSLNVPPAGEATAGQRLVALVPGPPGDVTTAVSTTSGIPMLTLTGTGDALVDAARALSTDLLGLSGTDAQDLSQQTKPRSTARTRTLEDLGTDSLTLERLRLGRPAARAAPGLVRRTGLVDGPAPEGLAHARSPTPAGPGSTSAPTATWSARRHWARRRRSTSTCTSPPAGCARSTTSSSP